MPGSLSAADGWHVQARCTLIEPEFERAFVWRAGHMPLVLLQPDYVGKLPTCASRRPLPLGLLEEVDYQPVSFPLSVEDRWLAFSGHRYRSSHRLLDVR